jgi:hypothetical protein
MDIATQYRLMIVDLSRRVPLIVRETENGHFITIRTKYGVSVATLSREIALEAGLIQAASCVPRTEGPNVDR